MADRLGDPTPRLHDRLSLNPIKHYDPVGTTMLIVSAVFLGFPFGWAKPVPIDPYNLDNPKRDSGLIAIAGPVINILMAVICALLIRLVFMESPLVNVFLVYVIMVNVSLAIFNLIPIHPLDGSKVLMGLLPTSLAYEYQAIMNRYGTLLLMFAIIPWGGQSPISSLVFPLVRLTLRWLSLVSGTSLGQAI